MHTSTANIDISLSRGFQKYILEPTQAHGLLYHDKDRKSSSKKKWNDSEYHVQVSKDMPHISVKISCVPKLRRLLLQITSANVLDNRKTRLNW